VAGAEGMIFVPKGNPLIQYAWGLGQVTNNVAEALWYGWVLSYLRSTSFKSSSLLLIKALINHTDPNLKDFPKVLSWIHYALVGLVEFQSFHILFYLNSSVDKMAKQGTSLGVGE
jgi:hypothetical protein